MGRQRVSTPPDLERVYTTRNARAGLFLRVAARWPTRRHVISQSIHSRRIHVLRVPKTVARRCRTRISMTRGAESPEVLGPRGSSRALIPRPHQVAGVAPPSAPPIGPAPAASRGRSLRRAGAERPQRAWRGGAERLLSAGAVVGPRVGEGVVAGPAGLQRGLDGSGQFFKSFSE